MKTFALFKTLGDFKMNMVVIICFVLFIDVKMFAQNPWSYTNLSSTCIRMGVASHGPKVYFAGGTRGATNATSNIIDIYNVNTQQWSIDSLSVARDFAAGVSVGSKVIFAGGNDFNTATPSSQVDIFDTLTQQWTSAQLSIPRFNIAAVSYGDEVLFAGGVSQILNTAYATVDKYNSTTNTWSTTALSSARCGMGFVVAGSKAYFAGGYNPSNGQISNIIDIYDFNSGTWSTASLSVARCFLSAAVAGNKIVFAGGMVTTSSPTNQVDIYDISTGNWSTSNLFFPRAYLDNAASACGKAFFGGGGTFNLSFQSWTFIADEVFIYDPSTGQWDYDLLSNPLANHGVIANGNQVFFAGGSTPFPVDTVNIYTCQPTGLQEMLLNNQLFSVYPNPANDILTISCSSLIDSEVIMTLQDITGKQIYKRSYERPQVIEINVRDFDAGVYMLQFQHKNFISTKKVIVER